MKLNFSKPEYKKIAMSMKNNSESLNKHSIAEAFMLLIRDVPKHDLSNLCIAMKQDLKVDKKYDLDVFYRITQGEVKGLEEIIKRIKGKTLEEYILDLAYGCIEGKIEIKNETGENEKIDALGKNITNNGINTSSWISHSLYEAKAAIRLAELKGLDREKAGTLAMLHDYGRKFIHDFSHVIKGFEKLVDVGFYDEARACITHSFINAGRCANCDAAEEGFYIDEKGIGKWENDIFVDDIAEVLSTLTYDQYDDVLNIADLMATSDGITTPFARVEDIASRKIPDPRNRTYFLSEFINKLSSFMASEDGRKEKAVSALMSENELLKKFYEVSCEFYEFYQGGMSQSQEKAKREFVEQDEI